MALRINHNIAALNTLRNLEKSDRALSGSLERLSSGLKVNRAADGPAALVISEQMRGQIASVNQAIQNSESSISMVQTAEASLDEVNRILTSMRQLAVHAANEGANDENMLAADQAEIDNAMDTIDRIARTSQFGTRTLLDGSNGANGVAVGEGLEFVAASAYTKSSPVDGYPIDITQASTRAEKAGSRPIQLGDFDVNPQSGLVENFEIRITESGRNVVFSAQNSADGDAINNVLENLEKNPGRFNPQKAITDIQDMIAQSLQNKAVDAGMNVDVFIERDPQTGQGVLKVQHKEFGSEPTFFVSSTVPGILSNEAHKFEEAVRGHDVEGSINGKIGLGDGEILMGAENTEVEGLAMRFAGIRQIRQKLPKMIPSGPGLVPNPNVREISQMLPPMPGAKPISKEEEGDSAVYVWEVPSDVSGNQEGFVHLTQNSLSFQVGPTQGQQVKLSLIDSKSERLANGKKNSSNFRSLREIDVTSAQGAQDSMGMIDSAISEVSSMRATLGAFQKNTLQSNTNSLRIARENLSSAESSLRDADMAEEMSGLTRNQIMLSAGVAMLAQANQTPQSVLTLLGSRQQ